MTRIGLIAALFAATVGARSIAQRQHQAALPPVRVSIPAEYMRTLSLSFDSLAADILWIRFLQRLPMRPADDELGRALATELEAVVTLDPNFRVAHMEGSVLLSILGNQQCAALKIAQQGAERFPADWRLDFQAGYICFSELRDTPCAVRHMTAAAKNPDAPKWLPRLVARLLAEESRLDAAVDYLTAQAQRETDPRVKELVVERLKEAVLTRELDRLDQAIRSYRLAHAHVPEDWETLVAKGFLAAVPVRDPFGGSFEIGHDGRARTTSGREPLRTFRIEDGLLGTPKEKILAERVVARLERVLGNPPQVVNGVDRLRASAGDVSAALQGLELLRRISPEREEQIRLLEARVILHAELATIRAAHLRLLRKDSNRTFSMSEIAEEAGVPPHDAFGDPYVLSSGAPEAAPRRVPITPLRGVLAGGSTRCP